ncbi:hypothetical protein [Spirillospora albida]|uniref:hypothetical protein n=1 Tax=Spirillospora albida TaxID=58123 RepID=UPI0004C15C21|nr:hypothetical protein [Spirillospora albida]
MSKARGNRWVRRAVTLTTGAMVTAGVVTALGAPANAAPSGCTYTWGGGRSLTVKCAQGDGMYRAKATCARIDGRIPSRYQTSGPWVAAGPDTKSTAVCGLNAFTYSGGVEFA